MNLLEYYNRIERKPIKYKGMPSEPRRAEDIRLETWYQIHRGIIYAGVEELIPACIWIQQYIGMFYLIEIRLWRNPPSFIGSANPIICEVGETLLERTSTTMIPDLVANDSLATLPYQVFPTWIIPVGIIGIGAIVLLAKR